jgi:hypothetical protein
VFVFWCASALSDKKDPKIIRVWLHFDNTKIGLIARSSYKNYAIANNIDETWTPIDFCVKRLQLPNNVTISRKQIPLACAESLTIHKSQGGTYDYVKVKVNRKMCKQALYVALSRVKKLDGLFIDGNFFCPRPNKNNACVKAEISRMLSVCPVKLNLTFLQKSFCRILVRNSR